MSHVKPDRQGVGHRVQLAWWWLRRLEPARLWSAWTAVIVGCAAVGVAIPADLDRWVKVGLVVVGVLVPLVNGEAIRRRVVPLDRHAAQIETARQQPPPM